MASFSNAFSYASNIIQGENGENKLRTSNKARLDSFNLLLKESSELEVKEKLKMMFDEYKTENNRELKNEMFRDIFVLAFHKRATSKKINDVQLSDGEGFKKLFYMYILELYIGYPEIVCEFAKEGLIAIFGYWKDYIQIWAMINENNMSHEDRYTTYNKLILALREGILNQRRIDIETLREFCRTRDFDFDFSSCEEFKEFMGNHKFDKTISFVGKYCIRENSSYNKKCYWYDSNLKKETHIAFMCRALLSKTTRRGLVSFSDQDKIPFGALKKWRIVNAKLNCVLDVPEVKFCEGNWAELKIGAIPSICFHKQSLALLNEKKNDTKTIDEETGNRFPENEDRVMCRNNVIEHISSGKSINVSALLPNEIIGNHEAYNNKSTMDKKLVDIKWNLLLEYIREKMNSTSENMSEIQKSLAKGNMICCCDTSASMTWVNKSPNRPYDVAIALTAFCSQLASEHYRNKAMTFSTDPSVYDLSKCANIYERISEITSGFVCGSTNYEGMHSALINLCKKGNVPESELPVLVIFTDGEFNQMVSVRGQFDTAHKKVIKMWVDAGYSKVPLMCYWNLAPNRTGVQGSYDEKGIILLQGPSPSNIKFVLYGEGAEETEVTEDIDGETVTYKTQNTDPYTIFRKVMDQPFFEPIRVIVNKYI